MTEPFTKDESLFFRDLRRLSLPNPTHRGRVRAYVSDGGDLLTRYQDVFPSAPVLKGFPGRVAIM